MATKVDNIGPAEKARANSRVIADTSLAENGATENKTAE